ncbi:hypothetical protein WA588_003917, partial [Blastocystis sp. NMH]
MNPPAKTDKTVVVGDFEFSSIQLSSLEGKELSQTSQVYPVLKSIEVQTDKGFVPLFIRVDDASTEKVTEPTDAKEDSDLLKSFYEELSEQPSSTMQPSVPYQKAPKSLAELSHYHQFDSKKSIQSTSLPKHGDDLTTVQLFDIISKFPNSFRQPLLNLLRVVEDKYEEYLETESQLRGNDKG